MMFDKGLVSKAKTLLEICEQKTLMLATVESCTGGLLAGCLTAVPGSSAVVERGWVTYSNQAKIEEVGVDPDLLAAHGAVSPEVAAAMAAGALRHAPVDLAAGVTGVAGPGGGSAEKPVGLVYISAAAKNELPDVRENRFGGDRDAIREASVAVALDMLLALAKSR
jgi:nicotinamide-nucleotide amidase